MNKRKPWNKPQQQQQLSFREFRELSELTVKWKKRNKNNPWSAALQLHSLTQSAMSDKAAVQSQKRMILHQQISRDRTLSAWTTIEQCIVSYINMCVRVCVCIYMYYHIVGKKRFAVSSFKQFNSYRCEMLKQVSSANGADVAAVTHLRRIGEFTSDKCWAF